MPVKSAALALAVAALLVSARASAYRPFDATDADVAKVGELELELGPTGVLRAGADRFLVAPAAVVNVGILPRVELVLQGRELYGVGTIPRTHGRFLDSGAFVKAVLREGSLQEKSGPSVAAESGVLLPTSDNPQSVGGSATLILSQRASVGTVHVNASAARTVGDHADVFAGVILEGPSDWAVRPVAEVFDEAELGAQNTTSLLVGGIWRAHEMISVDLGARTARSGDVGVFEARIGFTIALSLWGHSNG